MSFLSGAPITAQGPFLVIFAQNLALYNKNNRVLLSQVDRFARKFDVQSSYKPENVIFVVNTNFSRATNHTIVPWTVELYCLNACVHHLPILFSGVISPWPPSSVRFSCRFFSTWAHVLWSSYRLSKASLARPMYCGSSACKIRMENGTMDPVEEPDRKTLTINTTNILFSICLLKSVGAQWCRG